MIKEIRFSEEFDRAFKRLKNAYIQQRRIANPTQRRNVIVNCKQYGEWLNLRNG